MRELFFGVLQMSAAASLVILVVLLARLLLCRAPRQFSYLLWAVVGFRLLCPISFQSVFSLFGLLPAGASPAGLRHPTEALPHAAPAAGVLMPSPAMPPSADGGPSVLAAASSAEGGLAASAATPPKPDWLALLAALWLAGVAGMLLYSLVGELRLRRRLATATRLRGSVFQAEQIGSPFILGLVRPRIYVPYGLDSTTLGYVLAHERFHLRHGDPLARRLGLLALALHWFNPLCWLAFYLMGKDMELRCDEGVLKSRQVDPAQYSRVLLAFATNRRFSAVAPLAFGETGVKARILNVLRWKKPRRALTLTALVLAAAVITACAANPVQAGQDGPQKAEEGHASGLAQRQEERKAQIREEKDGNGQVIRREVTHPDSTQREVYDYGPGQTLVRSTLYQQDGSCYVKEYDAHGRVCQAQGCGPTGEVQETMRRSFDEQGRQLREEHYVGEDGLHTAISQDYDEKDRQLHCTESRYDPQTGELLWEQQTRYTYEGDRLSEKVVQDSDGLYIGEKYDDRGNLVEISDGPAPSSGQRLFYDGQGREILRESYDKGGQRTYWEETAYDGQGRKLGKRAYQTGRGLVSSEENTYTPRGNLLRSQSMVQGGAGYWQVVDWVYNEDESRCRQKLEKELGADGAVKRQVQEEYDEEGRQCWRMTEDYNEQGQRTFYSETQYESGGIPVKMIQQSFENGLLRSHSDMALNPDGVPLSVQTTRYDEKGNVTEQTLFYPGG